MQKSNTKSDSKGKAATICISLSYLVSDLRLYSIFLHSFSKGTLTFPVSFQFIGELFSSELRRYIQVCAQEVM